MPEALPTTADVARALLPGVRIALREKYGRGVRMAILGPLLPILIQILAHFLMRWLQNWLAGPALLAGPESSPAFAALAESWDRNRPYEVEAGMRRAAAGETGE